MNGVLWLDRQCSLTGMVVGFAELGGAISIFPTAVSSGHRLTQESRLVFEPKILLLEPPTHWGGSCSEACWGRNARHAHDVRALPGLLHSRPAFCCGAWLAGRDWTWMQTRWWPADTRGYPSAFGIPVSRETQNGRGQYMSLKSQVKRGGLCSARLPDPRVFSPTERREAAREPVHLRANTSAGGHDPKLQVGPSRLRSSPSTHVIRWNPGSLGCGGYG